MVVPGAEGVHVRVPFLSLFGAGLGRLEIVNKEGEAFVDIGGLEVGKFFGNRFGSFNFESDFDKFVFLGSEGKCLRFEGELFDIIKTEEEIVEWGCGVVGDFDSLGSLAVELNDLGVDCD
jgi:hypothetical protein